MFKALEQCFFYDSLSQKGRAAFRNREQRAKNRVSEVLIRREQIEY